MKKYVIALMAIGFLLFLESCYYDNKEDLYVFFDTGTCDTTTVTFSTDVVDIMNQYCISCHSNISSSGNVNLEGYTNVHIYGTNGSLYGSIIHDPAYSPMPTAGQLIPQCDQDKIKAWIDLGMPNN